MSSQSPSSSALPVAVTLAFVLALPSWVDAMAPPEQTEPATEGPIVVVDDSPSALFPVMGGLLGVGFMLDDVAQVVGLGLGFAGVVRLGTARRQARLSATGGGLRLQF